MKKMYVKENLNPHNKNVGDCVIRAISKVLNQSWGRTYIELAVYGYTMADLQSADSVWNQYLLDKGFKKALLPINCPNCITVREFADIYSKGRFLLFVGEHVVPVVNGNYYDTWDSGDRIVIYFYEK
jgi:hypothetical protein